VDNGDVQRTPESRRLGAAQRVTAVLDALGEASGELGTNELARSTGINPSTVSRLLGTLVDAGYVEHVGSSGRYRLGLRVVQLAQAVLARLDVRQLARPLLERLVEETGETATLSLPAEQHAVTVDFAIGPTSVVSVARVGRPSVAHATAVGKVMLAFGGVPPPDRLDAFTDATIVSPERLAEELRAVRAAGFATNVREREVDLNALAAPVVGRSGALVAILGLQGPAGRLTPERIADLEPAVRRTAAEISTYLGAAPR
jgi:DNA-binding IclR family transcriptional regulator